MRYLKLRPHWHTDVFRRTVKDAKGNEVQLEFVKDEPTEVSDAEFEQVMAKQHNTLIECAENGGRLPVEGDNEDGDKKKPAQGGRGGGNAKKGDAKKGDADKQG